METPNKATKLKWMEDVLKSLVESYNEARPEFFSCILVGRAAGQEARDWYQSVIDGFVECDLKDIYEERIEMFHDIKGTSTALPNNVKNRIMWLFMLKTLVEDGQL